MVAMPGDLLTGAYYPWTEYNYGYAVHVPIKNPLISDSFSQFFVWKKLITESYESHNWPLWNSYSDSGYPLLANFHSAAVYPLNIFFLLSNLNTGWNYYLMSGVLLSILIMYLLLRNYEYPVGPSLIGSFTYGFSGYAFCWLEFATAGQAIVWLPLLILLIEKYFKTRKSIWLLFLSPVLFLLTTAGHFQIAVYGFALTVLYFLFKSFSSGIKSRLNTFLIFGFTIISGLAFSALQLLPTLELSPLTVRFNEVYIANFNYGLLPIEKIITLFAPDYFGNPTTGNYWGFLNYHETILYGGIIVIFALIWCIYNLKKLRANEKFFLIIAFISLLLAFDNPIGKLIYDLKVPFISTSNAGRVIAIFVLSTSVLITSFLTNIRNVKLSTIIRYFWGLLAFSVIIVAITYGTKFICQSVDSLSSSPDCINVSVASRNLILPILLTFFLGISLLLRKTKIFYILIGVIVIFDMFRFGWKYVPFVKSELVFPETPVTNFLTSQNGIFRVDKERGPLLPPNTWIFYNLMSPSGYDPMTLNSYSKAFFKDLNGNDNISSRYLEIDTYDAEKLGNYNVKYLLALKRDEKAVIPGDIIYYKIDLHQWKKVYETASVAVLLNENYKERAFLESGLNDSKGNVKIIDYKPNKVVIEYYSDKDDYLVLTDTYYPGWHARVNGRNEEIEVYNNIFRKVKISKGKGTVEFEYYPESFRSGLQISSFSFLAWLIVVCVYKFKKRNVI